MRKVSDISLREVNRSRGRKIRPTGKFIPYKKSGKTGKILFIHKDGKVSFPGGGVDPRETLLSAILRENSEELKNYKLSARIVRNAKIFATSILETTKLEWKNKKVYLIATYAAHLDDIKPSDHVHYDFKVLTIAKAIEYIKGHKETPEKSRKFYVSALRKLAKLKGWKV